MWRQKNRGRYDRSKLRYPNDLTEDDWDLIRPMIPPAKRGGTKRTVSGRDIVNGMVHIFSIRCQWAALPKDMPPRSTVNDHFHRRDWDGTLGRIHRGETAGRVATPHAASARLCSEAGLRTPCRIEISPALPCPRQSPLPVTSGCGLPLV